MNFQLREEQQIALDGFRRFCAAEIKPVANRYHDHAMPKAVVHDLYRKLGPYGVGTGWVPEEVGGFGLDLVTSGLLYEELSTVAPGLAASVCVSDGVSMLLHLMGTPEQKARYIPRILSGDLICSIAVTEPDTGSNVAGLKTRAVREGDQLRLVGEKTWISNGNICDIVIVVCRLNDALSMVLVERENGLVSRDIDKLGFKDWSTAQLFLDDVRVPATNLVGAPGDGLKMTLRSFERARCYVALFATGIARAALADSLAYAKSRVQWGKPIGGHQLVQSMLAEMATEIECSRMLALRGLSLVNSGQRCDTETSMAKWYATEAAVRITSNAIQIHGAYGLSKDFPVERHFRNARMLPLPDGTTQLQKLIIGRNLTGISAFG